MPSENEDHMRASLKSRLAGMAERVQSFAGGLGSWVQVSARRIAGRLAA
jgi:hypothetical protein